MALEGPGQVDRLGAGDADGLHQRHPWPGVLDPVSQVRHGIRAHDVGVATKVENVGSQLPGEFANRVEVGFDGQGHTLRRALGKGGDDLLPLVKVHLAGQTSTGDGDTDVVYPETTQFDGLCGGLGRVDLGDHPASIWRVPSPSNVEEPGDVMKIAAFGDVNIDVVLDVEDLPVKGGEVFSTRRRELLGGSASNTAVVLSRLGFESAVMGAVGDDDAGRRALYGLGTADVSTDLVSVSETHPTAMNTVMVTPDGERTMIGARGANVYYTPDPGWREDVDWLHVSGYSLMEGLQQRSALDVIAAARERSIPCSLDVPVGVGAKIWSLLSGLLDGFRVVSGSQHALDEFTDSSDPVAVLAGGPAMIAVTSGADPLLVVAGEKRINLTPPAVHSVDVTGAGDAFAAGLIAAGLSELEPGPTAVLAAATGAAATLGPGASGTLADREVWSYLLDDDRWPDADPSWLAVVRTWVDATR